MTIPDELWYFGVPVPTRAEITTLQEHETNYKAIGQIVLAVLEPVRNYADTIIIDRAYKNRRLYDAGDLLILKSWSLEGFVFMTGVVTALKKLRNGAETHSTETYLSMARDWRGEIPLKTPEVRKRALAVQYGGVDRGTSHCIGVEDSADYAMDDFLIYGNLGDRALVEVYQSQYLDMYQRMRKNNPDCDQSTIVTKSSIAEEAFRWGGSAAVEMYVQSYIQGVLDEQAAAL